MPEVTDIEVPPPHIAGLSWVHCDPLFAEPNGLSDEHVGTGAPVSSGECFLDLMLQFADFDVSAFGTPILLKRKANEIAASTVPLPHQPSLPPPPPPPPPVAKRPCHDRELMS